MKIRTLVTVLLVVSGLAAAAQPTTTPRDVVQIDAASLKARQISVRFTNGLKAYHTGNLSEALNIFNGILLDNPKHDASYFMLSMVYTSQNNTREAIDALQHAIKLDKSNIWYKVDLADLYMQTENYAQAAKLWEQICKVKDNNEYYLYTLSEAYVNMEKFDKVVDTYNRMEKLMGHNDEITRAKVSVWLYQNKVNEAIAEYESLMKIYPHNSDYYVKAGDICQSNNMPEKAIKYYQKAAEMNSDDPNLNINLANYYAKLGDDSKKNEYLSKVFANADVSMDEKVPYMRGMIAKALRENNPQNLMSASMFSDTLIAVHPDNANGYAFKATLLTVQKKYTEALSFYEKALDLDNTSYSVWDDYCYVLNQLDKWERLLKYEDELMTLFPTNAVMLTNLGLGHLYAKHPDKSIELLKQALSYTYEKEQKRLLYNALAENYLLKNDQETANQWRAKAAKL